MKKYEVFASEGGYRYAGEVWASGPVLNSSPWFSTVQEAQDSSDAQRARDEEWMKNELDRIGISASEL